MFNHIHRNQKPKTKDMTTLHKQLTVDPKHTKTYATIDRLQKEIDKLVWHEDDKPRGSVPEHQLRYIVHPVDMADGKTRYTALLFPHQDDLMFYIHSGFMVIA